ncbi:MAG: hypothetical protein ABT940_12050 [Alphaproteobacteria bacterium]
MAINMKFRNGMRGIHADIIIMCKEGNNILDFLGIPRTLYNVKYVTCQNMMIGFECHKALRDNIDDYDFFCYMEDDLIIEDSMFFDKISWFANEYGDGYCLLPNRYEETVYREPFKKYLDKELKSVIIDPIEVKAPFLGREFVFRSNSNVHSGCFFLTRNQMRRWIAGPTFLDMDTRLISALESAASLGIAKNFRSFKPGVENLEFFEIRHYGCKYLTHFSAAEAEAEAEAG